MESSFQLTPPDKTLTCLCLPQVQCGAVSSVDVPKHVSTRNGRPALCVTSSDKKGLFVFPSLPPGNYDLVSVMKELSVLDSIYLIV